ncbi:Alpha/Beta hydrolase protein [Scenedesmus sp. NREL 46B-D3]|nr:Alpha/Beta hydrolase protein [Scenedesmus sp. NREL 46B-D3]
MCSSGAKTVLIKAKRSTVTDLLTMLAYYETTTHLHELSGSEKEKRVLSYIVLGHPFDAPEPPKQAIVYHHGWPSCRYEALPLHDAALRRKWRVIAVDRYGVGKSTLNPQGSFEAWAADIKHLLDTLRIQRAVMLGMSGGGPYACACARYLPTRTAALVTVAGMLATNDPAHADLLQQMHWMDKLHSYVISNRLAHSLVLLLSLPVMALQAAAGNQQTGVQGCDGGGLGGARSAADAAAAAVTWQLLPELMLQSVAQGMAGLGWDMKLTSSTWSFDPKDIAAPVVLVCHGNDDVSLPASMARRLAEQIPGAQLHLYAGEGHLSLLFRQAEHIMASLEAALQQQ